MPEEIHDMDGKVELDVSAQMLVGITMGKIPGIVPRRVALIHGSARLPIVIPWEDIDKVVEVLTRMQKICQDKAAKN